MTPHNFVLHTRGSRAVLSSIAVLLFICFSVMMFPRISARASVSGVVISQVYGGGGNAGSTFKNDFIELFNAGTTSVSLTGWSVQYASAAGTTWQVTQLSGSLAAGQFYLVQESQGAGGTTALPTPNATGTIAMAAGAGKVALVSSVTALSGGCPTGGAIVDFVGYGTGTSGASCFEGTAAAPTLTNTTSDSRTDTGADTDNNSADFSSGAPNPRNSVTGGNPTGTGHATPSSVPQGSATLLTVVVSPGSGPASTGITVNADLSSIGGSAAQAFFDDGTNGDVTTGDNTFSFAFTVSFGATTGAKIIPVTVQDAQGRSSTASITLTVTTPPQPLAIHDIQGTGETSPVAGKLVQTTGIVTAVSSNGFFIQVPDSAVDSDPNTPEGIFVFTSSAPPATVAIGNSVQVIGTVNEFVPSGDPNSPPSTEIGGPTIVLLTTGNPLPTAINLTAADTNPAGPIDELQKYKGMLVHIATLNVVAPTDGNVNEANATSTSNGLFFGVLPGIARPFREPGIELPDPLPAGAPANIPRFDHNPELIRVDSDALPGSTALDVTTGATVTNVTGPLDFASRFYTILVTPTSGAVISGNVSATPVPVPTANELTIANFNMERFFDTVDDPTVSDVALTPTAFANRLNKASLAIRNVLNSPDIIGVEEMENITTLQAVANKVNGDAVAAGKASPGYEPFLIEGNDIGGIDVGFLVGSRVNVLNVVQVGKDTTFVEANGTTTILNDRPALVLTATVAQANSDVSLPITVIVNHLRSLISIDDPTDGPFVRQKRQLQAEFMANLLQSHQSAGENVVQICDCNAFEFNDGYVDVIGTVIGKPAPADQVVNASPDLVNPDFTDLLTTLPRAQQYSYSETGSAQTLDHVLVNSTMLPLLSRFAIARNDADFPEVFRNDPNRPERISDHDMPVAYFKLPDATPPVLHLPGSITAQATSAAGAIVVYVVTVTDAVDANVPFTCTPASGSQFALGVTTVNCTATNSRNKTATGSFLVNVVDTTAPMVSINGITNGAVYILGAVPTASCSTTDSGSGVGTLAHLTISGGTTEHVGHFTATCSGATDKAGNTTEPVSVTFDVHYIFSGFLQPLRSGEFGGRFEVGKNITLEWELQNVSHGFITTRTAIASLQVAPNETCTPGGAGTPFHPASNNGLRIEGHKYDFDWRTDGLRPGCYSILLALDDGTTQTSIVRLERDDHRGGDRDDRHDGDRNDHRDGKGDDDHGRGYGHN
jgi:predicted extracellular nuclease